MDESSLAYSEDSGILTRSHGWFWRRTANVNQIESIIATSDDAITHEEIHVHFVKADGTRFVVSEFDENFESVMQQLRRVFPGLKSIASLNEGPPFEWRSLVLWEKDRSQ